MPKAAPERLMRNWSKAVSKRLDCVDDDKEAPPED